MVDVSAFYHRGAHGAVAVTALAMMGLEYGFARLSHRDTHDARETMASLGVAVVQAAVRGLEAGLLAIPFVLLYEHRLFDFEQTGPWALAGLFLGSEFFYYWQHRAAHRIRWFWASHRVHHSATRLNFTAAIRLGWTGGITGNFLFFLPLALIGYHPVSIGAMLGLNLLYQFFIHTELAPKLGRLEWVLNTPTHHGVHHAANPSCLDTNYGGVLIVFDRLFGTFAGPPDEALRYGLVGVAPSYNPVGIALGEWAAMLGDAGRAGGLRQALRVLASAPGSSVSAPPVSPGTAGRSSRV